MDPCHFFHWSFCLEQSPFPWATWSNSVQFSSVQDGISALGKAHMRSTLSLRSFPNVAFKMVSVFVWLIMALSRPFKDDHLVLPLSTPLSSRWSVVWCPWLCARRLCLKLLRWSVVWCPWLCARRLCLKLLRWSVVWCPWLCARRLCLKLLRWSDLPRSKPFVKVALPASLSAWSFPFTAANCLPSSHSDSTFLHLLV